MLDYQNFKRTCQLRGLKATNQRFFIYKSLLSSHLHPTADQLFEQLARQHPALGRDTVYRTLNALADLGLARRLTLPGGAAHFDGDLSPHQHFLCESCGAIYDLPWPALETLPQPNGWLQVGQVRQLSLLALGRCRLCLTEPEASASDCRGSELSPLKA